MPEQNTQTESEAGAAARAMELAASAHSRVARVAASLVTALLEHHFESDQVYDVAQQLIYERRERVDAELQPVARRLLDAVLRTTLTVNAWPDMRPSVGTPPRLKSAWAHHHLSRNPRGCAVLRAGFSHGDRLFRRSSCPLLLFSCVLLK